MSILSTENNRQVRRAQNKTKSSLGHRIPARPELAAESTGAADGGNRKQQVYHNNIGPSGSG